MLFGMQFLRVNVTQNECLQFVQWEPCRISRKCQVLQEIMQQTAIGTEKRRRLASSFHTSPEVEPQIKRSVSHSFSSALRYTLNFLGIRSRLAENQLW